MGIIKADRLLRFFLAIFLLVTAWSGSASEESPYRSQEEISARLALRWTIYFVNVYGQEVALEVEVAQTEKEQETGLMMRRSLPADAGMIFVYSEPDILRFWMRHTSLPLSIAFIGENDRLQEIYDMKPFDERIVSSTTPAIYAIEVNRGWFNANRILPGCKLRIEKTRRQSLR